LSLVPALTLLPLLSLFLSNNTPTSEIYTLSLHDALPISFVISKVNGSKPPSCVPTFCPFTHTIVFQSTAPKCNKIFCPSQEFGIDRKSTRLNSSHVSISYAVFCLKKKKIITHITLHRNNY